MFSVTWLNSSLELSWERLLLPKFLVTTFAFAVDFLATGLAFAGADFLAGALVFADLAAGFVFVVDLSVFGVGMESY